METLSKIAIYMGMGIALSVFVMFTISIMPHLVNQIENNWEDTLPGKSDEEIKKLFYATESYDAFIAKYPDNGEYYDSYGNGYGRLQVTAMNFETYNTLQLTLEYDRRTNSVEEQVRCENQRSNQDYYIHGTLSTQFIQKVDCLGGTGIVSAPSNLIDDDGNPVPIKTKPEVVYVD